MNIILISTVKSWGGVKTWTLSLTEYLCSQGHNTAIVCRKGDLLTTECKKRHLKCYSMRFGVDFSVISIWKFWCLFKAESTDIIITNISKGLRTAGIAAKLKGVRHINRLGAFTDLKINLKNRLLYSLFVDAVFVPSRVMYDYFYQYDFLRTKLRMFYNAINVPPINIVSNPVTKFAVVAKLSKRKQVDKVILAFNRIRDLPWKLYIGGFGPELESLQKLIRDLDLEKRINISGKKIEPTIFLRDKDAGILYSASEPFGIAIIEYMAVSCAVIASRVGGIPEIIEHNIEGILVDPQNSDELEQAIRLLITDPRRREELIQKGHAKVKTSFDRKIIFPNIEEELLRIIRPSSD